MAREGWASEDRITQAGWADGKFGYSIWFARHDWHGQNTYHVTGNKAIYHAHTPDLDRIWSTALAAATLARQALKDFPDAPPFQAFDGSLIAHKQPEPGADSSIKVDAASTQVDKSPVERAAGPTHEEVRQGLKTVIPKILEGFSQELYARTREQLEELWHFRFDPEKSAETNIYHFHDMLKLYSGQVRRWEEHHNGCCCVVERVRDQYLMPKIVAFAEDLKGSGPRRAGPGSGRGGR